MFSDSGKTPFTIQRRKLNKPVLGTFTWIDSEWTYNCETKKPVVVLKKGACSDDFATLGCALR